MPKLRQFANSVLYVFGILSKGASVISTTYTRKESTGIEFMYNVFRYVSCMAAFICNTILVYFVQYCILCKVTSVIPQTCEN